MIYNVDSAVADPWIAAGLAILVTNVTDTSTMPLLSSGAGAPSGTPSKIGDVYIDTTNLVPYVATAAAAATDFVAMVQPMNYDAVVYIEGTKIYAKDKYGKILSSATAGTNDAVVINAALTAAGIGGTVMLGHGNYVTTTPINMSIVGQTLQGIGGMTFGGDGSTYLRDVTNFVKISTAGSINTIYMTAGSCTVKNIVFYECYNAIEVKSIDWSFGSLEISTCRFARTRNYGIFIHADVGGYNLVGELRIKGNLFGSPQELPKGDVVTVCNIYILASGGVAWGNVTALELEDNIFEPYAARHVLIECLSDNGRYVQVDTFSGNYFESTTGNVNQVEFYAHGANSTVYLNGAIRDCYWYQTTGNALYVHTADAGNISHISAVDCNLSIVTSNGIIYETAGTGGGISNCGVSNTIMYITTSGTGIKYIAGGTNVSMNSPFIEDCYISPSGAAVGVALLAQGANSTIYYPAIINSKLGGTSSLTITTTGTGQIFYVKVHGGAITGQVTIDNATSGTGYLEDLTFDGVTFGAATTAYISTNTVASKFLGMRVTNCMLPPAVNVSNVSALIIENCLHNATQIQGTGITYYRLEGCYGLWSAPTSYLNSQVTATTSVITNNQMLTASTPAIARLNADVGSLTSLTAANITGLAVPVGPNIVYSAQTAAAGGDTTHCVLHAGASTVDDMVNGLTITFTSGARSGESSVITDYVGSTKTATMSPALTGAPDGCAFYVYRPNTYKVRAIVNIGNSGTTGNKFAFTWPIGCGLVSLIEGDTSSAAAFAKELMSATSGTLTATAFHTVADATGVIFIEGTIKTGYTAGTLQLQYACVTSGTLTVKAGSYIEVTPLNTPTG